MGRCIVYTGITLLLLIHPFIFHFFLSNFQTLRFFVTFFSGTVRPRRLKLDTYVDNGWLYSVYRNHAAAIICPFISSLYPRHLCRGVTSFRLSIRMFVRLFVLASRLWNYFTVLRSSNSSGVYLTNHSSESIHIWTIGTLDGRLSFHDSSPQGPCPGVGLEVKI